MQIGNCTFHNVYLDKPEAAKDLPLPSVLKWRVSQLMIQSRMRGEFGFQLAKAEVDPDFAARVKHLCVKGTKNKIWMPQVYKDVGLDKEPVLHKQVEVLLSTRWLEMINDEIENKGIDGLFKEFVIDVNFRNTQAD
ncbi:MAG: hypothetical protein KDK48_05190, partial [Chlamydiia bacterium]|nr:hypothetical protein [Chlamydiia bacterium]